MKLSNKDGTYLIINSKNCASMDTNWCDIFKVYAVDPKRDLKIQLASGSAETPTQNDVILSECLLKSDSIAEIKNGVISGQDYCGMKTYITPEYTWIVRIGNPYWMIGYTLIIEEITVRKNRNQKWIFQDAEISFQ